MMKEIETYSDIELFAFLRIKDGGDRRVSEAAFKELYARLSPRIYAYCRRVLTNAEAAQDVFQDTFVRFYKSAQNEREMTNVAAFLLRIARNLCLNAKRDNQHHHIEYEDFHSAHHDTPHENNELLGLITRALDRLQHDYREVFVLREYDGLSYAEIGEIVGCTEATAKIRSFRAKQKIREILAPYLEDLSK
jgi:RNA polymerase sigma-70 factor (ECF subfamily)